MSSFHPRDTLANRLIGLGCLLFLIPCLLSVLAVVFYIWPIAFSILPVGLRPVPVAQQGEVLLLVAELDGSAGADPTEQIDKTLQGSVLDFRNGGHQASSMRIGRLADIPLSDQEARKLGQHYHAAFVLWGAYDSSDVYTVTCSVLQPGGLLEPDQFTLTLQQDDTSDLEDLAELLLAIMLYHSGDYYHAETVIDALPNNLDPTLVAIYQTAIYRSVNNYAKALSAIDAVLAQQPDDAVLLTLKASILLDQAQYEEAIDAVSISLEQEPDMAEAYFVRGAVYRARGDAQSALDDYTHALELAPDNIKALRSRAQVHQTLGNTQAALSDYTAVIELDPDNYQNYLERAGVYTLNGDKDAALADFEQALVVAEESNASNYD
ncbi:MAG: tetratricopeptide repeat protein [Anaerolineae bacterium]|nr:tetratricopeptide repeat protein [Anaerolineae bacterium]